MCSVPPVKKKWPYAVLRKKKVPIRRIPPVGVGIVPGTDSFYIHNRMFYRTLKFLLIIITNKTYLKSVSLTL